MLEHLPWRIAGVVLLAGLVVGYQPEAGGLVQRLLIPVAMGVATWLMVQNLAAVALGGGVLAAIHSAPGSADPVTAVAYPAVAVVCGIVVAVIYGRRFRRRIAATHDARWRHRHGDDGGDDQGPRP